MALKSEQTHWYPSKVDWWLAMVLAIPPLVAVYATLEAVLKGDLEETAWSAAIWIVVAGIYLGLVFPMRYGIGAGWLTIRFGLVRRRIPLSTIREVYPTRNPLSSPALSLDRLHVQYGSGFFKAVMISPADREGFLSELAKQANLQQSGDRLQRSDS